MSASTSTAGGAVILGRRVSQLWLDVAIAVAFAVIGALEVLRQIGLPATADAAEAVIALAPLWAIIGSALSLSLRRLLPTTVLVITTTALLSSQAIDDAATGWVSMMIAAFSAGMQGPSRRSLVLGFALLTAITLTMWVTVFGRAEFDPILPALVLLAGAFVWAGSVLRERTRQAAQLQAHTVRLELEREREAERAAAAERTRIARELHDVIAHSLSVIVIQAAAGRRVMDEDRAAAREALDAVEETGRAAMVEMRRLLGVVRHDDDDTSAPRTPQPSLDNLERLVEDMRQAGLDAHLSVEGDPGHVAPGVDVSAYRIVQEALTNALRHAPGATVQVSLRYQPTEIQLEITDDGAGRPAAPGQRERDASGGHGLVGMHERVTLLRGQLEVGPRPDGGFRVLARLPRTAS